MPEATQTEEQQANRLSDALSQSVSRRFAAARNKLVHGMPHRVCDADSKQPDYHSGCPSVFREAFGMGSLANSEPKSKSVWMQSLMDALSEVLFKARPGTSTPDEWSKGTWRGALPFPATGGVTSSVAFDSPT